MNEEAPVRVRVRLRVDPEVAAMQKIYDLLVKLDKPSQERIMAFVWDKYVTHAKV